MLKCIIIDDEPDSLNALQQDLQALNSWVQVVQQAHSVATAVAAIDAHKPDVILLDIKLGDGSGFDVLGKITWKNFKLIFVTAYNEYAIKAFKVNAVDYLLKPIVFAELQQAISKIVATTNFNAAPAISALQQYHQHQRISFATAEGYSWYNVDDIIRCESDNNYSVIYFSNNDKIYLSKTLKELEDELTKHGFERIHKSHLINLNHLKKYLNKDGGLALMSDDSKLPVAQRKKTDMIALFNRFGI